MNRFAIVSLVVLSGATLKLEKSYIIPSAPTSPWTAQAPITVLEGTPPEPSNLLVADALNGRDIQLQWTCPDSPLITGFEIERERFDGTNWVDTLSIFITQPTARAHTDAAGPGTWRHRIRSLNNRISGD